jgi:hypothetical protein
LKPPRIKEAENIVGGSQDVCRDLLEAYVDFFKQNRPKREILNLTNIFCLIEEVKRKREELNKDIDEDFMVFKHKYQTLYGEGHDSRPCETITILLEISTDTIEELSESDEELAEPQSEKGICKKCIKEMLQEFKERAEKQLNEEETVRLLVEEEVESRSELNQRRATIEEEANSYQSNESNSTTESLGQWS